MRNKDKNMRYKSTDNDMETNYRYSLTLHCCCSIEGFEKSTLLTEVKNITEKMA